MSVVVRQKATAAGVTPITATFAAPVQNGNSIIAVTYQQFLSTPAAPSDNASNSYSLIVTEDSGGDIVPAIYAVQKSAGAPTQITIATPSSPSNTLALCVYEVSELVSSGNFVDQIAALETASLPVMNNVTTTGEGEFCVCACALSSRLNGAGSDSWSLDLLTGSNMAVESQIRANAGSLTPAFSYSSAGFGYNMVVATFFAGPDPSTTFSWLSLHREPWNKVGH